MSLGVDRHRTMSVRSDGYGRLHDGDEGFVSVEGDMVGELRPRALSCWPNHCLPPELRGLGWTRADQGNDEEGEE